MGGGCSMYGGGRRGAYRVFVGKPEGESHLKDLGMDGRSILKWICKKWDGEVWGYGLAEDGDKGWACVCMVMNL